MIYDSKRVLNFDIQPRRVLMRQLSGRERWTGGRRRRNPPLPTADLRSLARGGGREEAGGGDRPPRKKNFWLPRPSLDMGGD